MGERRTLRGWFEYLDDTKRELTESEFMALMLFNTREYGRLTLDLVREQKDAAEGAEGVLRRLDAFAAVMAERAQLPYPRGVRDLAELQEARAGDRQEEPREM